MWYIAYCGDERPPVIDNTSSKKWTYVRRNIERFQNEEGDYGYRYEEMKVPKELYDIVASQASTENRLADIEEVITEIVGGGF